jgi:hypothetical protein
VAMTETQKLRLRQLSAYAMGVLADLRQAQIEQESDRERKLHMSYARADATYNRALRMRGLKVGDIVRVLVDCKYQGQQAKVVELADRRVYLRIDGHEVAAKPDEVELVEG